MRLTLYGRRDCHLCADMLAALEAVQATNGPFTIDVIDIDADAALAERFGELVPVLFGHLRAPALCHHFIDEEAVRRYLAAAADG